MQIDYCLLGKRLASARKNRNMTQEALAERTGLTNNFISNIETGRSIPSLETVSKLCDALNITPNDLLLGASTKSEQYMQDELWEDIKKCTPSQKRLLHTILKAILTEQS